jgi:hypothetical protein
MKTGDQVRVWPLGDKGKAATGTVTLAAENGNSLALSFGEDYVPFMTGSTGMAIHPEHGKMLLLHREADVWYDVFEDGCFEVEELKK